MVKGLRRSEVFLVYMPVNHRFGVAVSQPEDGAGEVSVQIYGYVNPGGIERVNELHWAPFCG